MSRQRDLDKLLSDLRSFLLILDRESLSAAARAKKKSVSDLLSRLQSPPSEDAEYMIMRCLSPSPGTPQGRTSPGSRPADAAGGRACECRPGSALSLHGGNKVPGVPPPPPADDSYEDAEPPGRGTTGGGDSDSSHYESYGEEEEDEEEEEGVTDRAHYLRWPSATSAEAEPPGRPEAQLCGFLWRKRWLGQWAKQLFIVREHVLLCFRCAADLQPVLELDLRGCRVTYKDKRGKKMPHALKVTGTAGEVLVIGFQSRQQAEDWRKVIEEVSSDAPSGLAALSVPASPSSRLSRLGKEEEEEEDRSWQSAARSPRSGEDAKGEPGAAQRPVCALRLDGCEVSPGTAAGSPQNLRICIAQRGRELALLQARSDEEREAWLKTLQARGGVEPKKGDGPPPGPPGPPGRAAALLPGGCCCAVFRPPTPTWTTPSGSPRQLRPPNISTRTRSGCSSCSRAWTGRCKGSAGDPCLPCPPAPAATPRALPDPRRQHHRQLSGAGLPAHSWQRRPPTSRAGISPGLNTP
ncbi:actin filament-associated protein 1-like 2 isoform X4 [Corvus cornix cornix]|uniref:actin filament-associated protein 1-like 2 isoform X4 n=1 Tax=Corvus cornix cornix TaxID=932674 RepID=UPI00194E0099|nr:actin filament-associated protein 1-like 2 isoform X4 [Corvus cornix cornix]